MNNMLEKVTNINTVAMGITDENGIFTPAKTIIEKVFANPSDVVLYTFDILKGTAKAKRINLNLAHAVQPAFMNDFITYWYYLVGESVADAWKDFIEVNPDDLTEDEKAVYTCIKARHDSLYKSLKAFDSKKAAKVCVTVSDMVKAVYGMKEDNFSAPVQTAFGAVKAEIANLNNTVIEEEDKLPNLKTLRAALEKMCNALWRESGACEKFVFHANAALTADVYRVAYTGRKLNKDGDVVRTMDKGKKVLGEVVYACIEELQRKAK